MMTTIANATFSFLKALKEHNNREWFQEHKADYDAAHLNVKAFVQELIYQFAKVDPFIKEDIPVSKCLFRIYRDTRFSKDKTPYKHWFGAGISIAGRKLNAPEYYFHIEPGNSFLASGYWQPEKEHLAAIRQEIDYNGDQFLGIIQAAAFKQHCELGDYDKLKKAPAGYESDHPLIEYLKLKSFTASKSFTDQELSGPDAVPVIIEAVRMMLDFKYFLHAALEQEP